MWRLLVFAGAVTFIDTMFFAALAPLVPYYAERFDLSQAEVGVLTGIVAAGALAGAVPSGLLVARIGVRWTLAVGLLLSAVANVAFGFASSLLVLDLARFGQGFASAISWTAMLTWLVTRTPAEQRGETLGLAMGAAVIGSLFAPLLGGVAAAVGPGPAFTGVAVVAVALAVLGLVAHGPGRTTGEPIRRLFPAMVRRPLALGVWIVMLPATVFGVVVTLAPLELDRLGWTSTGVAGVFLVSAALAAVLTPAVGRWSDRAGRARPVCLLFMATAGVLALMPLPDEKWLFAALVVAVATAASVFWAPGAAVLTDGVHAIGFRPELGFVAMNVAYGPGQITGAFAGGALAGFAGDASAYLLLAAACAATAVAVRPAVPVWVR